MMNPNAYPPHEKVIKHLVYALYGSGIQSEVVCSLNDDACCGALPTNSTQH